MIKAITLWQPWDTLVAIGAKPYETRHWPTAYRGDLVIHAAAKRDNDTIEFLRQIRPEIQRYHVQFPPLQYGKVLCVVTLADCIPTEAVPDDERRFGDFTPGRFAWKLENVRVFDPPIPAKGMQGLWTYLAH